MSFLPFDSFLRPRVFLDVVSASIAFFVGNRSPPISCRHRSFPLPPFLSLFIPSFVSYCCPNPILELTELQNDISKRRRLVTYNGGSKTDMIVRYSLSLFAPVDPKLIRYDIIGELLEKTTRVLSPEEQKVLDQEWVGKDGSKRKMEVCLIRPNSLSLSSAPPHHPPSPLYHLPFRRWRIPCRTLRRRPQPLLITPSTRR